MNRNRWTRHRPLFSSPVPQDVRKPKIRWRILPIVWLAVKKTCTVIGAFVLISVLLTFLSLSRLGETAIEPLPKQMVLYIEFNDGFGEMPMPPGLAGSLGWAPPTVHDIADAIDLAAKDDRVKGIMARMDGGNFSAAQTVEVRAALKRFQDTGKFASIYSPSYGEAGGGLGRFYVASAFKDRWMQPLGVVSIAGINAEMPFFRETLDKIGVKPEFLQRKEYKTAYESLTHKQMSQYNREEIGAVVQDIGGVLTRDIATDLGIEPSQFAALVNKGLFTADEALKEKLVTRSDYVDVLVSDITKRITGDPESEEEIFIDPKTYLADLGRERAERNLISGSFSAKEPGVAIVYVTGLILDSRIQAGQAAPGFGEEGTAAADEIAPALMDAAEDPDIKAVVLRIDSPGGSPVASETILRAADKVREKGKPVIVSMGTTAASGGYWVAAHADRIFAAPTTLTGSIGVVGGKFSAAELWAKMGVNWEGIQWGENSGLWSLNKPFSASQAERMNATLDQVYSAFTRRVAEGRKMTPEQVETIARGRVWTGISAKQAGLVDELGGLPEALDYAAKQLGAKDRFALRTVILPRPLTTIEELMAFLGEQSSVYEGLRYQSALGHTLRPVMDRLWVMNNMNNYSTYEPLRIQ